jgi:hypothetical protein
MCVGYCLGMWVANVCFVFGLYSFILSALGKSPGPRAASGDHDTCLQTELVPAVSRPDHFQQCWRGEKKILL